jgi:hypothetical protein
MHLSPLRVLKRHHGVSIMTSYLVIYTTKWAKLLEQSNHGERKRFFRFGLLPHEIAALNAK